MAAKVSQKQLQIDKTSKNMIIVTSIAAVIVVFCAIAAQSLFSQMLYQNKIVKAKKTALTQLEQNEVNVANLKTAYASFVKAPTNVIGGSVSGTSPEDGDNAKIILDALPSKYDFPALATSLEKLISSQGIGIDAISGTDDEIAQGGAAGSGAPQAVPIPFQISATGSYASVQNLTKTFEASIRPIQVQSMTLTANEANIKVTVSAQTYYQPEKLFSIKKQVIK